MLTRRQTRKATQRITRKPTQLPLKGGAAPAPVVLAAPTNLQVEII